MERASKRALQKACATRKTYALDTAWWRGNSRVKLAKTTSYIQYRLIQQSLAAPPRSEPRGCGGDEAAEAEGIDEVGCNVSERITTPKYRSLQRPTGYGTGRQYRCPSLFARWWRLCRGSWLERAFWHVLMLRDGVSVNLGDLLGSDLSLLRKEVCCDKSIKARSGK